MKKVKKTVNKYVINRMHLEKAIRDNRHLYFGTTFIKKDGSLRNMSAKLGVRKGLKGGSNKVVKPSNAYMSVYDNNAKGFRTLNLATVKTVTLRGHKYKIV